jgi:hypothetical protein
MVLESRLRERGRDLCSCRRKREGAPEDPACAGSNTHWVGGEEGREEVESCGPHGALGWDKWGRKE